MTEEKANEGDPIEAPPSSYKLEPERQGQLLWITGAPGLGKSTTGQLLSRNHGFVFYEGDCFWFLRNPYIPPNVPEPSLAQWKQRKLVGEGAEERQEKAKKSIKEFFNQIGGKEYNEGVMEEAYRMMCADIRSGIIDIYNLSRFPILLLPRVLMVIFEAVEEPDQKERL